MPPALVRFWMDERGSLLVSEWVFVATILVLALLSTAVLVRQRPHPDPVQVGQEWLPRN